MRHEGAVLIIDDVVHPWAAAMLQDVEPDILLAQVAAAAEPPEFLLLGVGAVVRPPPRLLREAFAEARVGLEVMSTPEACRLYNVLGVRRTAIGAGRSCRSDRPVAAGPLRLAASRLKEKTRAEARKRGR